jgi:hypothetical protein
MLRVGVMCRAQFGLLNRLVVLVDRAAGGARWLARETIVFSTASRSSVRAEPD